MILTNLNPTSSQRLKPMSHWHQILTTSNYNINLLFFFYYYYLIKWFHFIWWSLLKFTLSHLQSWPKISAPLVNMIKEGCENSSALIIVLNFYIKNSQKCILSLDNKNLKWRGNIIMKWMFFSNTHWPQLMAPFYSVLFETSICQVNRSNFFSYNAWWG